MKVQCPKCGKMYQVPDSQAGHQVQCSNPACQQTFTVPPPDLPLPPPPPPPPRTSGWSSWKLPALIGAAVMIASFFVPWWGIKFTPVLVARDTPEAMRRAYEQEEQAVEMLLLQGHAFYVRHLSVRQLLKIQELRLIVLAESSPTLRKPGTLATPTSPSSPTLALSTPTSVWRFGWSFATGIISLLFGIAIPILVLLPVFVSPVKRWGWTMSLGAALLAIVSFIMAVIFYFSVPGQNTPTFLAQGNMLGTYLVLVGTLAALAGTATEGTLGLIRFVRESSVGLQTYPQAGT